MVRFLHTADLQLGMTRRFLAPEAQARFTQARVDAVRRMGALAAARGCAFVVVCGDVFEANQVDRQVLARAAETLAEVPVPVYLLPGNHDPLDAGSVLAALAERAPGNVVVLDRAGRLPVGPGVELVAAPWPTKRPASDLVADALATLPPAPAPGVRVVVAHGAIDTLSPDRRNPALISLAAVEAAVAQGRVHYVAMGDRHSTTSVGSTGRVWYAGAPEATDFDELDPGNVLEVAIDEATGDVEVTSHRIGQWQFARRSFTLDGPDDLAALAGWLEAHGNKAETVVRLDLAGSLTLAERATLDEVLASAADRFACVDVWGADDDVVVVPDGADHEVLGLSGFAERALLELQDDTGSADARAALSLLYRLARGAA